MSGTNSRLIDCIATRKKSWLAGCVAVLWTVIATPPVTAGPTPQPVLYFSYDGDCPTLPDIPLSGVEPVWNVGVGTIAGRFGNALRTNGVDTRLSYMFDTAPGPSGEYTVTLAGRIAWARGSAIRSGGTTSTLAAVAEVCRPNPVSRTILPAIGMGRSFLYPRSRRGKTSFMPFDSTGRLSTSL